MQLSDSLVLTIKRLLLYAYSQVSFENLVLLFNVVNLLHEFLVTLVLECFKSLLFLDVADSGDDCIDAALSVVVVLSCELLTGNLLLHHVKNLFFELDALLLVHLEQ